MGLSVPQLLQEAKRFLATDQPRMAALYMRKALALLETQRTPVEPAQESWVESFMRASEAISARLCRVLESVFTLAAVEPGQSDFALAAEP